jgi:hypothetical protein
MIFVIIAAIMAVVCLVAVLSVTFGPELWFLLVRRAYWGKKK